MAGLRLWQGEAAGGTTLAARHSYQDRSKIGWFRGPRFPVRSRGVLSVSEIVLWLLKNSRSRRSQKFHSARMPYKRRSRFWWTFSIPRLGQFFQKMGFFNSHVLLTTPNVLSQISLIWYAATPIWAAGLSTFSSSIWFE